MDEIKIGDAAMPADYVLFELDGASCRWGGPGREIAVRVGVTGDEDNDWQPQHPGGPVDTQEEARAAARSTIAWHKHQQELMAAQRSQHPQLFAARGEVPTRNAPLCDLLTSAHGRLVGHSPRAAEAAWALMSAAEVVGHDPERASRFFARAMAKLTGEASDLAHAV